MAYTNSASHNEEFLPAALEILESPPSPLGRVIAIVIGVFFAVILMWAYLGKVDVVITGQGKFVPTGYVKTVQAFESGVVTQIHVSDGESVIAGQLLIELDPTQTVASVDSLKAQLEDQSLNLAVATALISDNPEQAFVAPTDVSPAKILAAKQQMLSLIDGYRASLQQLDAEKSRLAAQLQSVRIDAKKIGDTLPIVENRVAAAGTLLARDSMRQDDRLSLQQSLIEMRAARDTLMQSVLQLEAAIASVSAQKQQTISEFVSAQRAAEREAQVRVRDIKNQIATEVRRNDYRFLTAPVAGTIDQLSIHTIGGVLNAGQAVMNIVPSDSQQEVEAFVLNKDIGFMREGDVAEIKLEAFPFTRFGVLEGKVTGISGDAVANDRLGLVYKIRAAITTPISELEEKGITLSPGMNLTVEVISEQRRVIEYFISPLLRYKDEAIRER